MLSKSRLFGNWVLLLCLSPVWTFLLPASLRHENTLPLLGTTATRLFATTESSFLETTTTTTPADAVVENGGFLDARGMTERIMRRAAADAPGSGGAGSASTWDAFVRTEENWLRLKQQPQNAAVVPVFVTTDGAQGNPAGWAKLRAAAAAEATNDDKKAALDYDIVVCGGTLGLFFAMALLLRGNTNTPNASPYSVCVLEAGPLRGRAQEWNLSYTELAELVELGVLTEDDIDAVITTEFPACRSGFKASR